MLIVYNIQVVLLEQLSSLLVWGHLGQKTTGCAYCHGPVKEHKQLKWHNYT